MKTPRSSSFESATERIALVSISPMLVDAALTSPQREPSGIVKRCSPRLRKIARSASVNGASIPLGETRPNSLTIQVTPVFAARTIGRRVSTQRKTALARCCRDPAER